MVPILGTFNKDYNIDLEVNKEPLLLSHLFDLILPANKIPYAMPQHSSVNPEPVFFIKLQLPNGYFSKFGSILLTRHIRCRNIIYNQKDNPNLDSLSAIKPIVLLSR